jgi:hypothetical protein
MSLVEYARREFAILDETNPGPWDYDGATKDAALELLEVFARQGHSGGSSYITLHLFNRLASFKPLAPLGISKDEWMEVGPDTWQNKRSPSVFSMNGGRTWYDLDRLTMWQKFKIKMGWKL